ncbi:MAG TPA: creatininase family protein, partial [Acidimicrobiales bacterium]|nr:creatininase family protein [Acidimicrobiales bacterium]
KARYFADLCGPDLAAAITPSTVVLQPIGAVEHHGSHLPLATDALVVDALARTVANDAPDLDLLLLPTLHYGLSTEHVWAPGTVSLSPSTLLALLDDIAASVARAGAKRFAFLNTHGGNTHLLRVAARDIRARYHLYTFVLQGYAPPEHGGPPPDPGEEGLGIHGSLSETSVVLHLRPDLVDMSRAERSVPSWVNGYGPLSFTGGTEFAWLSDDLSPTGVVGDPTLATPDKGQESFAAAVAHIARALAEASRFSFPGSTHGRNTAQGDG